MSALFVIVLALSLSTPVVGQNVPELFERKGGLVSDKQTAIRVAEAILFSIYGERQIREQRPYRVKFSEGKWIIDGAPLPRGFAGGVFHIVIRQRDAQVVEIGHGV